MEFTFSKRARTISMALIVIGLLATAVGIVNDHTEHHQQTWASLFSNSFYFFGIALGALFFYALQYATESAWSALVKRVYEGLIGFLPIGAFLILVCIGAGWLQLHHLWSWMDPAVTTEGSDQYDEVIADKWAYLNPVFYWVRTIAYIGAFLFAARWFRKQSLEMDRLTGEELVKRHLMNYRRSALFLVVFAVFSSMLSWDWLMSIDVHWFSTLYGWYVFSGMWVSAMITAVITALYLKRKGYLPQVNNSHIQDMGKWVFAISFLWSYLFFSQFMLYWYANIPEEVTYFVTRIDPGMELNNGFRAPFWIMFFVNFAIPMVMLISRDAKRNPRFLIGVGSVIWLGHWLDVQMLVQPGALGHWHMGLLQIGMMLTLLGVFIFTVLTTLTKAPLTPVNHPYLDESVHHHI